MNSVNLITNALLAVTWEHSKKDYLDIIAPFVIYAAYHEVKDETGYIDVPELTKYVNNEFRLLISLLLGNIIFKSLRING